MSRSLHRRGRARIGHVRGIAAVVLLAAAGGPAIDVGPATGPSPVQVPVPVPATALALASSSPATITLTLTPTAARQERIKPPRRPPNRVQPQRPGGAPRRLPPNRVVPERQVPSIDRPDSLDEGRGRDADAADAGMTRLAARLGPEIPTGRGVPVALVEADEGGGKFLPDRDRAEFRNITFIGGAGGGVSGHATATARRFFGGAATAASGISRVHLFSASSFLRSDGLRMGERQLPATLAGIRIIANAWVGDAGEASDEARQRIDVLAARDGILIVAGLPNSGPVKPLLSGGWNVLQVGTNTAGHSEDRRRAGDGTGGERPRITAPGGATSSAVPVVAAAAAVLMETADGLEFAQVAEGERDAVRRLAGRPEVITAVLLAGARRENAYRGRWSDGSELGATPIRVADADDAPEGGVDRAAAPRRSPLDPAVGAGSIDVDVSHRILSGGPTAPGLRAPAESWSVLAPKQAEGRWIVDVTEPTTLTANLVWFRMPVPGRGLVLPNVDLELLRVDTTGAGVDPVIIAASITQESSVEGLHVRLDEPGRYVLRVHDQRPDERTGMVAVAWRLTSARPAFEQDAAPRPAPPPARG